jgi:hypothetical protein
VAFGAAYSHVWINGAEEQERRATSALLAVISAVREFGRALLGPLGAPAGQYETYIEVPFEQADTTVYPDGLIRTRRGERTWTALVEVKTGTNELRAEQLEAYLDIAKEQSFDAVIAISNEIPQRRDSIPLPSIDASCAGLRCFTCHGCMLCRPLCCRRSIEAWPTPIRRGSSVN